MVIAAILIMIILANLVVQRWPLNDVRLYYLGLALTLVLNFCLPIRSFLELPPLGRVTLAAVTQAAPLFFASLIFATTFQRTTQMEIAPGSNLIGAVLGGIGEYASLVLSLRSLYLIALGCYSLSALVLWRQPR